MTFNDINAAQASVITLAKVDNPTDELVAVKDALHSYGGAIDFDIDRLIYLGKPEPIKNITNGQHAATEENSDTPASIFILSGIEHDAKGELLKASVALGRN